MKTIQFHLAHPAHFHMLKYVIARLVGDYRVVLSYNDKDVLESLVQSSDLRCDKVKVETSTNAGPLKRFGEKLFGVYKLAKSHDAELMVGTTIAVAHSAWLLRRKSLIINEDDFDVVRKTVRIGYPFASKIMAPDVCRTGKWTHKTVSYKGYHELAYLSPKYFKPYLKDIEEIGLTSRGYVIMRFSSLDAHHDVGVGGIDDDFALQIIDRLKQTFQVIITTERPLSKELEPYRQSFAPHLMHDVLANAKMMIGDSQTMAAEAMVLGTPSIRCNDFVGRLSYLEELEIHYGLGFGVLPYQKEQMIEILMQLVRNDELESEWRQKRDRMLGDKVDVVDFWTNEIIKTLAE